MFPDGHNEQEQRKMTVLPYHGVWPTIAEDAFVAPGAMLIGDVRLGPGVSVWYNVVLRADSEPISIGARTNIQDGAIIHVDPGLPCVIGEDCTLGHGAIVHAARLGDHVLVAMHATVLSGATVGSDVIIGANALVSEGTAIEGGVIVLGVPGKVARHLRASELERVKANAAAYAFLAREHRASLAAAQIALDGHVAPKKPTRSRSTKTRPLTPAEEPS
jgi:carbonic anhydrase/acetyltransferase-like protein (isoleucine patch superfamily)